MFMYILHIYCHLFVRFDNVQYISWTISTNMEEAGAQRARKLAAHDKVTKNNGSSRMVIVKHWKENKNNIKCLTLQ